MELQIGQTQFDRWSEAYRLTLGEAEMIVVTEIGPRILSLSVSGGPNLLFVDDDLSLSRDAGGDTWYIYGGHRVWVAPESEASYAPDNAPCDVTVSDGRISVLGPLNPHTLVQKRLTVSGRDGRFVVESAILNRGEALFLGGTWAITCVAPTGIVAFPWGSGGCWDLKRITYWARWMDHRSDLTSQQWRPGPDLYQVAPTGEEGKVGTNSPEGWVALCRDDATFVKARPWAPAHYPDGGCSLEVYTCDRFIEMEMLGPLTTVVPGSEAVVEEEWTVTSERVDPGNGDSIRRLIGAL